MSETDVTGMTKIEPFYTVVQLGFLYLLQFLVK